MQNHILLQCSGEALEKLDITTDKNLHPKFFEFPSQKHSAQVQYLMTPVFQPITNLQGGALDGVRIQRSKAWMFDLVRVGLTPQQGQYYCFKYALPDSERQFFTKDEALDVLRAIPKARVETQMKQAYQDMKNRQIDNNRLQSERESVGNHYLTKEVIHRQLLLKQGGLKQKDENGYAVVHVDVARALNDVDGATL